MDTYLGIIYTYALTYMRGFPFRQELKWIGWMETVDPQQIKPGSAVESIIVQTLDSVRYGTSAGVRSWWLGD